MLGGILSLPTFFKMGHKHTLKYFNKIRSSNWTGSTYTTGADYWDWWVLCPCGQPMGTFLGYTFAGVSSRNQVLMACALRSKAQMLNM